MKFTNKSASILKSLNSNSIFLEIEKLILNNNKLKKTQKLNYDNFVFNHKFISKLIDDIRDQFFKINYFNLKKDTKIKIMHITNFNERFDGRLHYNTGRRFNNGFIRLGHNV